MSFGATKLLSASGGKAYEIDQSLMFNSADTAYLNRTPSGAGNRRTFTLSAWVKMTTAGFGNGAIFCCSTGTNDASTTYIAFYQGKMQYQGYNTNYRVTNRVLRDVGAWYHFVWAVDTTIADGSADNRIRLYVNGVEETSFGTKNNPTQNYEFIINSTNEHQLGDEGNQTGGINPWDGYMAEVNFIDGSQLTPSSFGEADSVTNAWIPKKYGGAYGTNGFYLKFVSGAIGTDSSGEGNNYTANNLADSDVLLDTPTNNFSTFNSLMGNAASGITLTQGNLKAAQASLTSDTAKTYSTIGLISGKWYVEVACSAANVYSGNGVVNVSQSSEGFDFSSSTNNVSVFSWGDRVYKNGSQTQSGVANAAGGSNILGIALNLDDGTVQLYSNGSTTGSAETLTRNTGDIFVFCNAAESSGYASTSAYEWNFGQNGTHSGTKTAGGNTDGNSIGNFVNAVPSGFLAPCTSNLATQAVKKSSDHFNTILYTGNDADDRTLTGVGFQPDWVWIKTRNTTNYHQVFDSVRGVSKRLNTNTNSTEYSDSDPNNSLVAFTSDGFTVDDSPAYSDLNASAHTYVAWNWRAGGASPSKTYAVKVVSDSGNKYRFDDYGTSAVTLNLQEGGTYTFDQSDSSNSGHPLRFSTTSDGSHGGGSEYTTGVTTNGTPGSSGAYTRITVAASAATLYYYCTAHSGMGGQVNTNTTSGATNLDGSILSVVSENTTSGFGIASYTGTGANATVGHELGVAPSLIIVKNRAAADNWAVYSRGDATDYLVFNDADGSTDDNTYWNDTAPTSSVFSIGTAHNVNASSETYVAYCFAEVEGFSKFGTYESNGNVSGPFVNTGFTPSWIVFKYIDGAGEWWWMLDSTRDTINLTTEVLYVNDAAAESSIGGSGGVDFLSNGFKIRATNGGINTANTYFYMAFAEFPFKYANAR